MSTINQVGVGLSGSTGTGAFVGATSPTLVTPVLGTPTSGTLTNCTGLPVAGGGTGIASATAYAVLCAGTTTTGAFQPLAALGASGTVLTSNGASALPSFQSLPTGGITYTGTASTTISAAVNNGYITTAGSLASITLPATAAVGDIVAVVGEGAGGWSLIANTGQTIKFIGATTSSAGSFSSTSQYDTILVVCVVANTTWNVQFAASAGLTIA